MDWLILAGVAVAAIVALVLAAHGSARRSRRGTGSPGAGMMGVLDEIYAPARHEAVLEMERQTSLPAPAPLPGDKDWNLSGGRIRIEVDRGRDGAAGRADDAGRQPGGEAERETGKA